MLRRFLRSVILLGACLAPLCVPSMVLAQAAASPTPTAGLTPAQQEYQDLYCFTQKDCQSAEYGGSPDRFQADPTCPAGFGTCLAPEPVITLQSPIAGQTTVKGFEGFVALMFNYILRIVGIAATVMFVYGGFQYIYGSSLGSIQSAKKKLEDATVGLIIVLGSVALLRTINPATLNLNAVKVFLIKRIDFSQSDRCELVKTTTGSPMLSLASKIGDPPGSIAYNSDPTKFTIPTTGDCSVAAHCGSTYYIQNTKAQICSGNACCSGNICLPKGVIGTRVISSCVRGNFGGSITWQNGVYPANVWLVGVCKNAQPDQHPDPAIGTSPEWQASTLEQNVSKSLLKGSFVPNETPSGQIGVTGYVFSVDDDQITQWQTDCEDDGGLNGALLAVEFKNTNSAKGSIVTSSITQQVTTGDVSVLKALSAGATKGFQSDDYAVLTKNDCIGAELGNKKTASYFSGYLSGIATRNNESLIAGAIYCGWAESPGSSGAPWNASLETLPTSSGVKVTKNQSNTHRFDKQSEGPSNPYWSVQDLKNAMNSKSAQCDFSLNSTSAPADPNVTIMNHCCPYVTSRSC